MHTVDRVLISGRVAAWGRSCLQRLTRAHGPVLANAMLQAPRHLKRLILTGFDCICALAAFSFAVGLASNGLSSSEHIFLGIAVIITMAGVSHGIGASSIKVTALGSRASSLTALASALLGIVMTSVLWAMGAEVAVHIGAITAIASGALSLLGKHGAAAALSLALRSGEKRCRVAVYGAGSAGMQVLAALERMPGIRAVALIDDNPALKGVQIHDLRVETCEVLHRRALSGDIDKVIVAIPSASQRKMAALTQRLRSLPCPVQSIPPMSELLRTGDMTSALSDCNLDTLLERAAVDLGGPEIERAYTNRPVLITGAGGSIGSELCRQMIACGANRMILLDHSEYALYTIHREMEAIVAEQSNPAEIIPVLGSVQDAPAMTALFSEFSIDTVLHAAAYKHVPLVEQNVLEGVANNVLGTAVVADAARAAGVERFVLVSTDKAVRPTSVMGATKRMAEMLVQNLNARTSTTRFAMVRFGNVIGSSGSVIPLFRSQIAAGGPVTLTHQAVTRYFMTIPEAARLVLLAGSYAEGGEVFVLDMGAPVRIAELARKMIRLSGLRERTVNAPFGDIEIQVTGLRPGEKLFEELLIGDGVLPTPHPKILCADETCPSEIEIAAMLRGLRQAVESQSAADALAVLAHWVDGYQPRDPAIATARRSA